MSELLFGTDFHGNERSYAAFFAHAEEAGVRTVVLGGDLLPPVEGTGAWIEGQRGFLRGFLAERLRRLRERYPATRVFALLGNDDLGACAETMAELEEEGLWLGLHERTHPLDGGWIAGYSCVPVTPFALSDWDRCDSEGWIPPRAASRTIFSDGGKLRNASLTELRTRPTIQADLTALAARSDPSRTIYVTHTPPFGTKLDVMYDGGHIGSRALREFLLREQPPLSLHGHIHASPERTGSIVDRLNRTVCVNPGSSHLNLRAVLLHPEDPVNTLRQLPRQAGGSRAE